MELIYGFAGRQSCWIWPRTRDEKQRESRALASRCPGLGLDQASTAASPRISVFASLDELKPPGRPSTTEAPVAAVEMDPHPGIRCWDDKRRPEMDPPPGLGMECPLRDSPPIAGARSGRQGRRGCCQFQTLVLFPVALVFAPRGLCDGRAEEGGGMAMTTRKTPSRCCVNISSRFHLDVMSCHAISSPNSISLGKLGTGTGTKHQIQDAKSQRPVRIPRPCPCPPLRPQSPSPPSMHSRRSGDAQNRSQEPSSPYSGTWNMPSSFCLARVEYIACMPLPCRSGRVRRGLSPLHPLASCLGPAQGAAWRLVDYRRVMFEPQVATRAPGEEIARRFATGLSLLPLVDEREQNRTEQDANRGPRFAQARGNTGKASFSG
ncbi:hypothetical protein B0J13DRAFT_1742 [Dactylonectria estremocensis]|uniref:Uncharacterized protein n=1 Tax=Dactylonectria estremocensis TaxID=1079267 RepID=A0A9P9JHW5_9HYPO|nr:hypothetical protein B0J13DRAFT_1742 [Dactylonectria estremocensis]